MQNILEHVVTNDNIVQDEILGQPSVDVLDKAVRGAESARTSSEASIPTTVTDDFLGVRIQDGFGVAAVGE